MKENKNESPSHETRHDSTYVVAAMAFLKNLTCRASLVDLGVFERVGREWSNSALTLKARAEGPPTSPQDGRGAPRYARFS
jgi:hypothetical protein